MGWWGGLAWAALDGSYRGDWVGVGGWVGGFSRRGQWVCVDGNGWQGRVVGGGRIVWQSRATGREGQWVAARCRG